MTLLTSFDDGVGLSTPPLHLSSKDELELALKCGEVPGHQTVTLPKLHSKKRQ